MAFDTAENQEEKLGQWSIIFLSPEDALESSVNSFDTAQLLPQYMNHQAIHILIIQTDIYLENKLHYFFENQMISHL